MMKFSQKIKFILFSSLIILLIFESNLKTEAQNSDIKLSVWNKIEPYFSPSDEFKNRFGNYRSPLKFYDGRTVKTPDDWTKRREEIFKQWNGVMGEWPRLIKHQKVEILETTHRENFTQQKIKFYWTPNEQTTGYLLIPDGQEKKPAVITVYYEPESAIGLGVENRDFAFQLVKRGFVCLSIGTTEATKAKTYSLYYPDIDNAKIEPLSMLGYAAANGWYLLSNLPEVDSTRIGIVGHSFGGKWAMFASCLFDKFACAVWSDPGIVFDNSKGNINYWEPWYLGYSQKPWRERGLITEQNPAAGLYPKLIADGYDLYQFDFVLPYEICIFRHEKSN